MVLLKLNNVNYSTHSLHRQHTAVLLLKLFILREEEACAC